MEICNGLCYGCNACFSACPLEAIRMEADAKGFFIPVVDEKKCISCGKCKNVCPANKEHNNKVNIQHVYSAWASDRQIRQKSSSGGAFSLLAEVILNNSDESCVFGAGFDKNWKVVHKGIRHTDEIPKIRGSKYVQSNIGNTHKEVKKELDAEHEVLFAGTPCQVAGLLSYLDREYSNLYTVDILCHGVPSPGIFEKYLDYIKRRNSNNITDINFRYKKPSWSIFSMSISFSDHKAYIASKYKDPYLIGFLSDLYLRDCCHACKYASSHRVGDITIADFWGYQSYEKESKNDQKGASMVAVNTDKGKLLFDRIKTWGYWKEQTLEYAQKRNPGFKKPYEKNKLADLFWNDYVNNMAYDVLREKYCMPVKVDLKEHILRFIESYGHIAPGWLILFVKKFVKIDE